jgi:hypothetical protein
MVAEGEVAEREEARLDKYREELQKMLAEFIEASATYFDAATAWADADALLTVTMGSDQQTENHRRWREAGEQLTKAETDARVKGFRLMMLVNKHDGLVAEVKALAMEPIPRDRTKTRAIITDRRERLHALTDKMGGVFIPETSIITAEALSGRVPLLLPSGREPNDKK